MEIVGITDIGCVISISKIMLKLYDKVLVDFDEAYVKDVFYRVTSFSLQSTHK